MRAAVFSPDRQRIHASGGENRRGTLGEKCVAGGDRKNGTNKSQRQNSTENDRVEMTGVIGHQDKGGVLREIFATANF